MQSLAKRLDSESTSSSISQLDSLSSEGFTKRDKRTVSDQKVENKHKAVSASV